MSRFYRPNYDTTVNATTLIQKHNTAHTDAIDWENYPFDDPNHFSGMCSSQQGKDEHIAKLMDYLRACEQYKSKDVFASSYSGWPRIWHRVLWVGMASCWPYWTPRPTIHIDGTLGVEWVDWTSITGVRE